MRAQMVAHRDLTMMCTNAKAIFVQWQWQEFCQACAAMAIQRGRAGQLTDATYLKYYHVQTLTCIRSPLTSCLMLSGQVTYCQFVLVLTTE